MVSRLTQDLDSWILTATLIFPCVAILLVRALRLAGTRPRGEDRHLLDGQFALGELSIDEYVQRRRLLE